MYFASSEMSERDEPEDREEEGEQVGAPRGVRRPDAGSVPPPSPDRERAAPDVPLPPEKPSFEEETAAIPDGGSARASGVVPPPEPPPAPAVPPPAPAPVPQTAEPASDDPFVRPPPERTGLAGPEFTAARGQFIGACGEEGGGEEGDVGTAPKPPSPVTSQAPFVTEWHAAARGAGGMKTSLLQSRVVREIAVGLVLILIALVGVRVLVPREEEGKPLALSYTQGQTTRYRVFLKRSEERVWPNGRMETMDMTAAATLDLKVASVNTDGATVEVSLSNIALHTGTPLQNRVPDFARTQMRVGRDGKIAEGGLGLSGVFVTKMAPGWDLLVPMLAEGPVHPGSEWTSREEMSFAPESSVSVSASTNLLSYLSGGPEEIAVITSNMNVPVQTTVPLAAVAESLGASVEDYGYPAGSDPKYVYDGQTTLNMTARLNATTGQVIGSYTSGESNYTVSVEDAPPRMKNVPNGVKVTSSFSMSLKEQTPEVPSGGDGQSPQPGRRQSPSQTPTQISG